MSSSPSIVIVGAGFGGVAAAIELRRHGFDDVTILEALMATTAALHDSPRLRLRLNALRRSAAGRRSRKGRGARIR